MITESLMTLKEENFEHQHPFETSLAPESLISFQEPQKLEEEVIEKKEIRNEDMELEKRFEFQVEMN